MHLYKSSSGGPLSYSPSSLSPPAPHPAHQFCSPWGFGGLHAPARLTPGLWKLRVKAKNRVSCQIFVVILYMKVCSALERITGEELRSVKWQPHTVKDHDLSPPSLSVLIQTDDRNGSSYKGGNGAWLKRHKFEKDGEEGSGQTGTWELQDTCSRRLNWRKKQQHTDSIRSRYYISMKSCITGSCDWY